MNKLSNNILPKTENASTDRVYEETKQLAGICAEKLGTFKTMVYWLALKEFYQNHVGEIDNELVS